MTAPAAPRPPVERKVTAGATAGGSTLAIVLLLVSTVPGLNKLPAEWKAAIPGVLAWLAHVTAAYRARHTDRPESATREALRLLAESGFLPAGAAIGERKLPPGADPLTGCLPVTPDKPGKE